MLNTPEAAADRLRRTYAGESPDTVYPGHDDTRDSDDLDSHAPLYRRADVATLATAYLADHPADGGEPITGEWLAAQGWREAKPGRRYELSGYESGHSGHDLCGWSEIVISAGSGSHAAWRLSGWGPRGCNVAVSRPATRGDLRECGALFWKHRQAKWFKRNRDYLTWNKRFAGKPAFAQVDENGYRCGILFYKPERAHRVVFKMTHGYEPTGVDHIDGDVTNNRPDNLAPADQSVNGRNMGRSRANTSGVRGVHKVHAGAKWIAQIRASGKTIHLGSYVTIQEAQAARVAAENLYGYRPQREKVSQRGR